MVVAARTAGVSAAPRYMQLMVFVIFAAGILFLLTCVAVIVSFRGRLRSVRSDTRMANSIATRASVSDLEKCDTGQAREKPRTGWRAVAWVRGRPLPSLRGRASCESDSESVLALLPGRRSKESAWRKLLGFLTKRKKRVVVSVFVPILSYTCAHRYRSTSAVGSADDQNDH